MPSMSQAALAPDDTPRRQAREGELDHRWVLNGVTWADFQRLLELRGERPVPRYAYLEGQLEIMSPSRFHEQIKSMIGCLLEAWCFESEVDVTPYGAWLLENKPKARGIEPDECYWVENEPNVRGKDVDLRCDPPPDLVIEIDISNSSIPKLPIFFALGVSEVWRYAGGKSVIYVRGDNEFEASVASRVLPQFPVNEARRIIDRRHEVGETKLIRTFRAWVHEHVL